MKGFLSTNRLRGASGIYVRRSMTRLNPDIYSISEGGYGYRVGEEGVGLNVDNTRADASLKVGIEKPIARLDPRQNPPRPIKAIGSQLNLYRN
jgi:hypothetical protein